MSNVLPRPEVLKDYPGSMSIGGNSIFDSSVNIDSQLSWQGFWFGEISKEVSRVEWKTTYLERGKESAA